MNIFQVISKTKFIPALIDCEPHLEDLWGSGRIAPLFLTSTLDGDHWSACFTPKD
jgi:hypothetical protein